MGAGAGAALDVALLTELDLGVGVCCDGGSVREGEGLAFDEALLCKGRGSLLGVVIGEASDATFPTRALEI